MNRPEETNHFDNIYVGGTGFFFAKAPDLDPEIEHHISDSFISRSYGVISITTLENAIKAMLSQATDEEMEEYIYKIKDEAIRDEIFSLIEKTASDENIVEMCSHAMYIGEKKEKY